MILSKYNRASDIGCAGPVLDSGDLDRNLPPGLIDLGPLVSDANQSELALRPFSGLGGFGLV
jgi:hypothetical protein